MVILNATEEKPIKEKPVTLKDTQRVNRNTNFENLAIKNVLQESWRTKIKHDKNLIELIDSHASNMQKLLGNAEYEVFCIHNLIANTKNMSPAEIRGYIRIIEGLTYFYNTKLGDLTSTLLTGLTFKAKNLESLGRYYKLMINDIDSKTKKYASKASRENAKIEDLTVDLRYKESSLINRFLRRGKLIQIKSRINARKRRLNKINSAMNKNKMVLDSVKKVIKGGQLPA